MKLFTITALDAEQVEYAHALLTSLVDFIHYQLEKYPIDDHKENLTYGQWGSYKIGINTIKMSANKIAIGSGGIRTPASEETGALNQRHRPLARPSYPINCERIREEQSQKRLLSLYNVDMGVKVT